MACQVTRSFANRACLDALGRQLQPSRDTGELTAQMQRLWQDLPQGVISDLIKSMPRRISADDEDDHEVEPNSISHGIHRTLKPKAKRRRPGEEFKAKKNKIKFRGSDDEDDHEVEPGSISHVSKGIHRTLKPKAKRRRPGEEFKAKSVIMKMKLNQRIQSVAGNVATECTKREQKDWWFLMQDERK
ncbi:hypothetical protein TNCV_721871 [Trichonephila clavipes]|nr:hypothetical protein TNCV_721871 [Trichonephila clavipes]